MKSPPDKRGGASTPGSADHHRQSLTRNQHTQPNAAPQHMGRYACGWREGFKAGAIDALRLAARRLPPQAWNVLDDLADAYELAASND